MELSEWVAKNRHELVGYIKTMGCTVSVKDIDELELWVVNDESLYNWALSDGVDI